MSDLNQTISQVIAGELNVKPQQILAAMNLLDEGNTIPFIARYRKEVTGGLDDTQLRHFETRLIYLRELDDRRQTILKSIDEQGKLSDELREKIFATESKTELEDLYLPYKPKRRTRGQIAIEAGLKPLAEQLWQDPRLTPESVAEQFISSDKGVADSKAALDGARYILMERFAEDAELLAKLRQYLTANAAIEAKVIEGKEQEGEKFHDYFAHSEPLKNVPSHRALAMFRGRNEGILSLSINSDPLAEEGAKSSQCEEIIREHLGVIFNNQPADKWREQVIAWTWKVKALLHLETELMANLREKAEEEAIDVFARNLSALLMAAPAGARNTMGLDPGLRTGVKVAVVDNTGKLLATDTIYPHTTGKTAAEVSLYKLIKQHNVELIAIGNGTASRETERFAKDVLKQIKSSKPDMQIPQTVVVSEAGASVYSASELAANEFPDLDVSLRGAVSIARRLQDPLAELVKIEPKAIGVGQYQHDVNQTQLARKLDAVVEDCVNAVGVDLNTASTPLLARVAGMSKTLAQNIVAYRDENGRFNSRSDLKKVPRLGPKAFEQCAGFMRILNGKNPLDASSVHPEAYPVVEKILQATQATLAELMGNESKIHQLNAKDFVDEQFGLPTVNDIFKELEKPGRDPRGEFKTATFVDGVEDIKDLQVGMILEGTVTNVANFGAFVDIGVHQDGLVHISMLSNSFVDDPHKVVKVGDVVKVKVLEVDVARKRIALSMRLDEKLTERSEEKSPVRKNSEKSDRLQRNSGRNQFTNNAFADALKGWKK
ncbi:RNA-binding transcriptional accessory protein [Haemophilus parahaemolyticus]|uniref:RNA-binding transcriptional accessory protein n=2 Tax=Haemophilus parahaemolyticus TaxID=735 RepID=A0AAE6MNU2_HAEPH|nr:Tex family protein [Haemophilus parahaemolyticus]EIJ68473.1 Tex-like protein N-terminal domain protein [Haemophilus parahaemolyticus HK385]OOR94315.1 RNA-binding transcriptional accessory protein [Haemophilus parahaemolyticus]QEN10649.1 RNA-binding transcriptional accessory protein [Haemophilus parahaemolyticus]QRP11840.1 RNA-binding transcriptional accessory protein [Haemophilus parahaemolyticus]STO65462.1 transcriptional accessory protein (S1 RNA binding domain) [Haemophilus parahaemolyti